LNPVHFYGKHKEVIAELYKALGMLFSLIEIKENKALEAPLSLSLIEYK